MSTDNESIAQLFVLAIPASLAILDFDANNSPMPTTSSIQPFVDAISSNWEDAFQSDEWFFSHLIDAVTSQLSPYEAFLAVDELVSILLQLSDDTLIYYSGVLLISLIRISTTSEIPPRLRAEWESVVSIFSSCPDILQQLHSLYRKQEVKPIRS